MESLLDMGRYGTYVWPSYALVIGLLGGLLWLSMRTLARTEERLETLRDGGHET
jgi:heme exporter protein CcmD